MALLLVSPAFARTRTSVPGQPDMYKSARALLNEQVSLDLDDLIRLPWKQIESRLERMPFLQIEGLLWMLTPIVDEVRVMSDIGIKLQKMVLLNESERVFLILLAAKYKLEYASTFNNVLKQDRFTSRDYRFIMLQFRQILRRQAHLAKRYTQIGDHLGGIVHTTDVFDSPIKAALWANSIARRVKAFKKLMHSIRNYERSLGE